MNILVAILEFNVMLRFLIISVYLLGYYHVYPHRSTILSSFI